MKDILSEEEVNHVAYLAKLKIDDKKMKTYQRQLAQLILDIDKIKDVEVNDDDILIAPVDDVCVLRDDVVGEMLDPKDVLRNVPRHNGNYIEVPVVINE
ncbi:MAG: Asp-tRNA(Asn)/Glu-tRNA(Gln) amidotransferase subunit GatC [Bacilli bacterium]|nr:Asp-tRNA(Asn)/Glu-tRNA(Gln) amidotransferase subunit GatC [Bacilli bacterium]